MQLSNLHFTKCNDRKMYYSMWILTRYLYPHLHITLTLHWWRIIENRCSQKKKNTKHIQKKINPARAIGDEKRESSAGTPHIRQSLFWNITLAAGDVHTHTQTNERTKGQIIPTRTEHLSQTQHSQPAQITPAKKNVRWHGNPGRIWPFPTPGSPMRSVWDWEPTSPKKTPTHTYGGIRIIFLPFPFPGEY